MKSWEGGELLMARFFNTDGSCDPKLNYMVDLSVRLKDIRKMVDAGKYFTINRARQYGKTTILTALHDDLEQSYLVISLDFQTISCADFASEQSFVTAFSRELLDCAQNLSGRVKEKLEQYAAGVRKETTLSVLFKTLMELCRTSDKKVVLMIDEIDTASNNQVFMDFLSQLRAYYLKRRRTPAFHSVILAGVYDIRNIRRKIHPEEAHQMNSPWNIAADFNVEMGFSTEDISGMLQDYENDYHIGMDIEKMAHLLYTYTHGYPFLVSRLCKFMDERLPGSQDYPDRGSAWTEQGFLEAEKMMVKEDNALYESLIGKLECYPKLKTILYELLFHGKNIPYTATNVYLKDAAMFGFIRNEKDMMVISNRIFETVLYNHFISEEFATSKMYHAGQVEKNQFIVGGHLDIRRILEKFIETFHELYGEKDDSFLENVGRKYFILFLKPIINGVGNYSIEPQTRDSDRMDLVIYYRGEQNILELKIWRGNAYHERGEQQLIGYLDHFHMKKGYMLSFNFNKKKEPGIKEMVLGDKILIEAVV